MIQQSVGVLDYRFLSKSVGLLDPPPPLIVKETDTVEHGLKLLKENKKGCLVVCDSAGALLGIFTERDVVLKYTLSGMEPGDVAVSELMTVEPKTIEMTTPMMFALQLMSEGGYRHLPIVDEDNVPMGMVSIKDIVDFVVQSVSNALAGFGEHS